MATERILVVDDEEPIREGLCMLLQEWGYDAIAAGSISDGQVRPAARAFFNPRRAMNPLASSSKSSATCR